MSTKRPPPPGPTPPPAPVRARPVVRPIGGGKVPAIRPVANRPIPLPSQTDRGRAVDLARPKPSRMPFPDSDKQAYVEPARTRPSVEPARTVPKVEARVPVRAETQRSPNLDDKLRFPPPPTRLDGGASGRRTLEEDDATRVARPLSHPSERNKTQLSPARVLGERPRSDRPQRPDIDLVTREAKADVKAERTVVMSDAPKRPAPKALAKTLLSSAQAASGAPLVGRTRSRGINDDDEVQEETVALVGNPFGQTYPPPAAYTPGAPRTYPPQAYTPPAPAYTPSAPPPVYTPSAPPVYPAHYTPSAPPAAYVPSAYPPAALPIPPAASPPNVLGLVMFAAPLALATLVLAALALL